MAVKHFWRHLAVSVPVAVASVVFLVVIHKLEYFLNAHLIGTQIRARLGVVARYDSHGGRVWASGARCGPDLLRLYERRVGRPGIGLMSPSGMVEIPRLQAK